MRRSRLWRGQLHDKTELLCAVNAEGGRYMQGLFLKAGFKRCSKGTAKQQPFLCDGKNGKCFK